MRSTRGAAKIQNPLNDWSNAAQAFQVSPVPRNLARLSIASRNLSTNFGDMGITISPENLIRSMLPSTSANEGTPMNDMRPKFGPTPEEPASLEHVESLLLPGIYPAHFVS